MRSSQSCVVFQRGRRRGEGRRLFLPLKLQGVDYLLCFKDGKQERYQIAYTASIEAEKSRQRWRYRGHLSRRLSIYNRAGERFEKADVDRRVALCPSLGDDAAADWHRWRDCRFKPESALPQDEFEAMLQCFNKHFAAAVIADKRRMENDFRQRYPTVEAITEVD